MRCLFTSRGTKVTRATHQVALSGPNASPMGKCLVRALWLDSNKESRTQPTILTPLHVQADMEKNHGSLNSGSICPQRRI